jgi:Family of unknown function (DUF5992)
MHPIQDDESRYVEKVFMKIVVLLALFFSVGSYAGYLVEGGTVTKVMNTENKTDIFQLRVEGGTTNQCEGANIKFNGSLTSPAIHARAYSTALTALATGMTVSVYNYDSGDDCNGAAYIEISK